MLHVYPTFFLRCSLFFSFQPPTLTDICHTIQKIQTQIPAATFSFSFSTNISIIHEAWSNIYVLAFPQMSLCRRIVEYKNLYSH